MKLIPVALSGVLLVYLGLDFVESNTSSKQNQSQVQQTTYAQPKRVSKETLAVEKKWQDLKAERQQATQPEVAIKPIQKNQQVLTLGDKNYVLYGIFNDPESPFILLKEEGGDMLKLTKGDKLAENATLVTLESNKIAFDKNNQIIEFKLFERKNNAPN